MSFSTALRGCSVDGRDRLRQYLEQRKELGESDLVLDGMTVDELMTLLGAPGRKVGAEAAPGPQRRLPAEEPREPRHHRPEPASPAVATPGTPVILGGSLSDAAAATHAAHYATLEDVAAAVAACRLCGLHGTARNPVPGEGSPEAKFVCVGEAPGATEDDTGRPFVGAAGQLLTKILAAIDFKREDVFICNVLKHRPPGNRNPEPDEIAVCSPYLLQQLAILRPRVILALGTFAAQTLLQTTQPIGKLRGQIHRFYGVPLVVTYHPAALLRNPNWKRPTWEDVKLARRVFDNPAGAA
jgi:DNA polymerase